MFQVLQSAPRILLLCWFNNPGVTGDRASCSATESCLLLKCCVEEVLFGVLRAVIKVRLCVCLRSLPELLKLQGCGLGLGHFDAEEVLKEKAENFLVAGVFL
jgi:hypothetical protein